MRVEIIDITDRSGSMSDIREDVIGGFNTMLDEQKLIPGEARFTQVQFDHEYKLLFAGKDIQAVEHLTMDTYVPRGMTALLDAIGRTLNEQGKRIAGENWAEKVIVCIRTDGMENSSKEYNFSQIKAMIKHAEMHNYVFVFSGADQDAFAAASNLGMSTAYATGYNKSDPHGTMASYAATGQTLRTLRADSTDNAAEKLQAKL